MMRRTIVRAALLVAGAAALATVAACGPQSSAGGAPSTSSTQSQSNLSGGVSASASTLPTSSGSSGTPTPQPGAPAQTAPAAHAGGGGTPQCGAATLKLTLGGGDGAAGHLYQALDFTNTGSVACVMTGFPGVSYVTGNNGQQLGAPAQRDGAAGPSVTLAPGATASAIVGRTDVGVFDPNACKPAPVTGLRVYPPNDTAALFVPATGTGCGGNPPSPQLRVQTVKSGVGSP